MKGLLLIALLASATGQAATFEDMGCVGVSAYDCDPPRPRESQVFLTFTLSDIEWARSDDGDARSFGPTMPKTLPAWRWQLPVEKDEAPRGSLF